jgi:hypothetical protein
MKVINVFVWSTVKVILTGNAYNGRSGRTKKNTAPLRRNYQAIYNRHPNWCNPTSAELSLLRMEDCRDSLLQ